MASVLLDDHLLFEALLGNEPPSMHNGADRWFTTGLWHHRLCRAVGQTRVEGTFSRRVGNLDPRVATGFRAQLVALPPHIGTIALRHLAWPMAQLVEAGVRLNLLGLEALAAAEELEATICLAPVDENPPLVEAAAALGVPVRFIEP